MDTLSERKRKRREFSEKKKREHKQKIERLLSRTMMIGVLSGPICFCEGEGMEMCSPESNDDNPESNDESPSWWQCGLCGSRALGHTIDSLKNRLDRIKERVRDGMPVEFLGVICDQCCDAELVRLYPDVMRQCHPPIIEAACLLCGWIGDVELTLEV